MSVFKQTATLPTMMPCLRLFSRTVLVAALACGGAQAQGAASIKVLQRQALAVAGFHEQHAPPRTASHELKLTLIYFSGSGWSRDAILEAVEETAGILSQCGVRLAQTELMLVDALQQYQYFQTLVSRELARTLQPAKPTVYFVTDTRQQPAFDAEAIGRSNSRTRPELADSVWMTLATRDSGIALAHELVHVLTDSGEHVKEQGNLMRENTMPGNTQLTAAQCARSRDIGTKNGLLRVIAE